MFDNPLCTRMLCFKLYNYLEYLKPFLVALSQWPEFIDGINGGVIIGTEIPLDQTLVDLIREDLKYVNI